MIVLDVATEFDLPVDRSWLNAAHQGPLPNAGAERVMEMLRWKMQPHHLQSSRPFTELPQRLRTAFADLIGASPPEVVLANSASYGLHLVANGLDLEPDDEVIVAANDFPSDILPWLRLEQFGVRVKRLRPSGHVLTAAEIAAAITKRTRVVCLTWVHSFSGHVVDLDAIGSTCRERGALFVVNGSQAVGAIPIAVHERPIDVLITVGFKWLCGPYGTGFCWLAPRAAERIESNKLYWLSALSTEDLTDPNLDLSAIEPSETGKHDVFGTANFFNNAAVLESVRLIGSIGVDRVLEHNLELAERIVDGVDRSRFEVLDRGHRDRLSSILFLRSLHSTVEEAARLLEQNGVDVAQRSGMLRLSPHLYNTSTDIDRFLAAQAEL